LREHIFNEPKDSIMQEEKTKPVISSKVKMITVIVIVFALISYIAPLVYVNILNGNLGTIQDKLASSQYNEVRTVKADISRIETKITKKKNVISDIDDKNYLASDLFTSIKQATPQGCVINSIQYRDGKIRISGLAENEITALELMTNLDRLDYIESQTNKEALDITKTGDTFEYEFTFVLVKEGR